jgi:hypothetical protein
VTLVVTASFAAPFQARFDALRRAHFPPALNRVPAHVSLFHKLPAMLLPMLVRQIETALPQLPPDASLRRVRMLGRGVAFDIDAPGLTRLHAELAASCAAHLTPQDRQRYAPHLTVQNKAEPAQARALAAELAATFRPERMRLAAIDLWHYCTDGTWREAARVAWPA